MTNDQVAQALNYLGFPQGWVVVGGEITVWENPEPQPTEEELEIAYAESEAAKEEARKAILNKLGLSADELATLLS
jgi:MOSC domain-containing protein YiiM